MAQTIDRLRRALADKPDAQRVELSRATVEALIAAADGRQVVTLGDAARLIQRQRYAAVSDALSAADDQTGEDAIVCFLNALSASDDLLHIKAARTAGEGEP